MGIKDQIARIRRMRDLRGAYRRLFLDGAGKPTADARTVLAELKYFCHGNRPTLKSNMSGIDVHASIAAAARQEVFFRIAKALNLDDGDLDRMERLAYQSNNHQGDE
jgi:hypothetical protein